MASLDSSDGELRRGESLCQGPPPDILKTVNRDAGYGLEIPCILRFYCPQPYVTKQEIIAALFDQPLL